MAQPGPIPLTKQGKVRQKEFAQWVRDNQFEESGIDRLKEAGAVEIEPRLIHDNLSVRRFFLPGNVLVEYSDDVGFSRRDEAESRLVRQSLGDDPYAGVVTKVNDIAAGRKPRTAESVIKVRKALRDMVLSERRKSDVDALLADYGNDGRTYNRLAESTSPEFAQAVVNAARLGDIYVQGGRKINYQHKTMAEDMAAFREGSPDNPRNARWQQNAYDNAVYKDEGKERAEVSLWRFIDGSTAVIASPQGAKVPAGIDERTYKPWEPQPDVDRMVERLRNSGYYEATPYRYIPDEYPRQLVPPRSGELVESISDRQKRVSVEIIEDRRRAKEALTKATKTATAEGISLRKGKSLVKGDEPAPVRKGRGKRATASGPASKKRGGGTRKVNVRME